jgi:hypothetical protein
LCAVALETIFEGVFRGLLGFYVPSTPNPEKCRGSHLPNAESQKSARPAQADTTNRVVYDTDYICSMMKPLHVTFRASPTRCLCDVHDLEWFLQPSNSSTKLSSRPSSWMMHSTYTIPKMLNLTSPELESGSPTLVNSGWAIAGQRTIKSPSCSSLRPKETPKRPRVCFRTLPSRSLDMI